MQIKDKDFVEVVKNSKELNEEKQGLTKEANDLNERVQKNQEAIKEVNDKIVEFVREKVYPELDADEDVKSVDEEDGVVEVETYNRREALEERMQEELEKAMKKRSLDPQEEVEEATEEE